MANEVVVARATPTAIVPEADVAPLFERSLAHVREDVKENPYVLEALRVLPVRGYRSAIGSFWNAVVDDLRNKITHRSLSLFNKAVKPSREVKLYEDFQNVVNDDQLIEGAYAIGVIGWEASKILKHAKETRHWFDGHPKSSEPSIFKVLAMMDDCVKYVLAVPYPMQIIDIDEYMAVVNSATFDRNEVAIENALGDLPDIYKTELVNRFFTAYIHVAASSVLRSNIEFCMPILWRVLAKDVKVQVVRRVDQVITKGNVDETVQAFALVSKLGAASYLTPTARRYRIKPLVDQLKNNFGVWKEENAAVKGLVPFASVVPSDLSPDYVSGLTHTFVGHMGASLQFSRTDFYANEAATLIPDMFKQFDDQAGAAFVEVLRTSSSLRGRMNYPAKLSRLRSLGNIVLERVSANFADRALLEALCDSAKEAEFLKMLPRIS